jgi:serine/threonine protein phosphatase PrpC
VEVIRRAFHAAEDEFLQKVQHVWPKRSRGAPVSSCWLLSLISGDMLYVANLSNFRAVLGRLVVRGRMAITKRLSTDHNVASEGDPARAHHAKPR